MDPNVEFIRAIAELWLLAGVVCFTFLVFVFRGPITLFLQRLVQLTLKTGPLEVSVRQEPQAKEEASQGIGEEIKALPKAPVEEDAEKISVPEPRTPDEWTRKMFVEFFIRNIEEADRAFQKLIESEADPIKKLESEALYLMLRYEHAGDGSALGKLHELARRDEVTSYAHRMLGACYRKANDFDRALEAFEVSAQTTATEKTRAFSVVEAAKCLFKLGKHQEAFGRIMHEMAGVTSPEALSQLYEGLASLYELSEDPDLRALALEKAIEIRPNDTSLHFQAAYSYSQRELDVLSLLHYKTLLRFDPIDKTALNNLGVQYDRLGMPIRSANMYKKSFEQEETLAAANLAFRLINAGFLQEARAVLDEAKKQEDIHPNVGNAIAALSDKDKEEKKTEDEALSLATEQQGFMRHFAEAYFIERPDPPRFSGMWRSGDGIEMTVTQSGNQVEAHWVRGDKQYKFTGQACNRAGKITTGRVVEGYSVLRTILGSAEESRGYVYLSSDGERMFIMNMEGRKHSFLTLDRIST